MLETLASHEAVAKVPSQSEQFIAAFRWMTLARLLDDKFANLWRGGKITGGVFLGRGQEALSASLGMALRKGDIFAPLIRDLAGRLAFGEPILDAVRTYLGSPLGPMRGRDGNVHRGRPKEGLLPMISHLGAMIPVVNGMLMARKFQNRDGVGATCIGEGGTSTGAFHEALNQAAVEKLPLVLVVANNQYAYSTPNSRQFACKDLADKAAGYGVESHSVDGTQLSECLDVVGKAVANARKGAGPQLVIAKLLRLCGHAEHDTAEYVDAELKNKRWGCDCLKAAEEKLLSEQWADVRKIETWRNEAQQKIEEAVAIVQREDGPDPFNENWQAVSSSHLVELYSAV